MSWTDERIEKLTKMWEGGATASQIAEELGGVSRNAVIGKAHRLGLKARPSPVKPNEKSEAAPAKAPRPAPEPAAPAEPRVAAPRPAPAAPASPPPAPRAPVAPVEAAPQPAAPAPTAAADAPPAPPQPRIVSVGPGGFSVRAPAINRRRSPRPAPPPRARTAQPGSGRQDRPARSQRPHLPLADGPPGRARFPFLWRQGESRLPLLRRALRPRLSGTAAARPSPSAAADALRRAQSALRKAVT